ncbi:MAG: hypothetical protein A2172_05360 [Candidatus Woykebacteria bacterium RBG_13_40_15]|uniref:Uncharacterized protein n=1 Tax=Candidatus Woykebacteria bacterium RBG_13_40_15 TaxID=1802593 RepID=A0A1G1W834_9BACT|nr:MAG: hypothetical protein A2172_05360 [Candidatus Woykebacteria bacterium RBG_13_40_15]
MSVFKLTFLVLCLAVLASALFTAYYFLIARPTIKADCLNAATRVVDRGERGPILYGGNATPDWGEEVVFDEAKYKECVKIL